MYKRQKEHIYYDYLKDNNFTELREAELLRERVNLLSVVDPYIGRYYSTDWVKKNVLHMSGEEIETMETEIAEEQESGVTFGQSEVDASQFPPEDNTKDADDTESETPELDDDVAKFGGINKE